jgi:hypothetical protein
VLCCVVLCCVVLCCVVLCCVGFYRQVLHDIHTLNSFIADVRGKKGSKNKQSSSSSSSNGRGSMHSDSLRLTDDDRVTAFVVFASLLSKSRRLKEANKALAEAKVSLY